MAQRPEEPIAELEPLERITLQMTSTLDLGEVLAAVTSGLIEDLGAALARIWLIGPGDLCAGCAQAPRCARRERCLHLRASSGLSSRLDGAHRRVPLGALKIGVIASSGEPVCTNTIDADPRIADKAWARANGIASFAGYPLVFRGEVLGVLAIFARRPLSQGELGRLSLFARRAAIAIEHARLFSELGALKDRLQSENAYLQEEIGLGQGHGEILGESPALLDALSKLAQVAPTTATVLLEGETGTGKELFARALHAASPRKDRPLVKVSCAAMSAGLVESELFGHEKGAFTGALQRRAGRFELADGGTLFLDEIGELTHDIQVKLLRVLQEREIERVGGSEAIRVDVRVVAATNRDLGSEVQSGRFRADLYYRLRVFPIEIPPLRARRDDIPALTSAFLARQARVLGKPIEGITSEARELLTAYDWPGNVRELHNVLERAAILTRSRLIGREDLPDLDRAPPTPAPAGPASEERTGAAPAGTLEEVERAHILFILQGAKWVIEGATGAAAQLGLHPSTLRSRMSKLGIQRPGGG